MSNSPKKQIERQAHLNPNDIENFEDYLFEYFYIFGLTPDTIYNKDITHLREDMNSSKMYYKTQIYPELISRFPPSPKPLICIDEKVIQAHVFPQGYSTITAELEPQPELFHFTLDNFISYDMNRKIYFTAYIIYEPYSKILKAIRKYKTSEWAFNKRKNNFKRKHSFIHKINFINDEYCVINRNTSNLIFSKGGVNKYLKRRKSYSKVFYKSTFDYNNYEHKQGGEKDIYFPKALVISSLTPYPDIQEKVLKYLTNICLKGHSDMPIERILHTLFINIPFLPKNQTNAFVTISNGTLLIKQRCINELPSPNYKMGFIYTFSIDAILEIYKNILLEIPTLFFSKDKNMLTNLYESFITFLYPFRYQYPNCSILPKTNYSAIVLLKTFFFGINQQYTKTFFTSNNICVYKKKIFIVDIDKKQLAQYSYEDENTPIISFNNPEEENKEEREINFEKMNFIDIALPANAKSRIVEKIKESKANYDDKNYSALRESVNIKITSAFFNFFLMCFSDYLRYMFLEDNEVKEIIDTVHTKKNFSVDKLFKIDLFLKTKSKADLVFYNQFLNTQLFIDFLIRRYEIKSDVERLQFMFIDESIVERNNKRLFTRNIPTYFINADNKINKRSSETVNIPFPIPFNSREMKIITEKKKTGEILEYLQDYRKGKFRYIIFPKLLYDDKFFETKFPQCIPNKNEAKEMFLNDCKMAVENKIFFSIYDGSNSCIPRMNIINLDNFLCTKEMENSISILWLRYYACTLKSNDPNEQKYRFQEMLNLIARDFKIDEYTINLIYLGLYLFTDKTLLIRFWERIEEFGYIKPNYTRLALLTAKLESKCKYKRSNILVSNKKSNFTYFQYKDSSNFTEEYEQKEEEEEINIKKRTFGLQPNEKGIETVQIDTNIECKNCHKNCELTKLSIIYQNLKKTQEMTTCPHCNKPIMPEVHVKLGEGGQKTFFHLKSPYFLNEFLTNNYIRRFGFNYNYTQLSGAESSLFWGTIWFFIMRGNTYEILLKYKGESKMYLSRARSIYISIPGFEKNKLKIQRVNDFNLK